MTFICVVVIAFCFFWIYSLQKKVDSQSNQIERLSRELEENLRDLHSKTLYNYNQIKRLSDINAPTESNINTQTENSTSTKVVYSEQNEVQNNVTSSTAPSINKSSENNAVASHVQATTENKTSIVSDIPSDTSYSAVSSVNTVEPQNPYIVRQPQTNHSQNAPIYAQMPRQSQKNTAYQPVSVHEPHVASSNNYSEPAKKVLFDKEKYKSVENWIGTRLLNITASLLVFIGLILFGTLDINQTVKMIGMHVISIGAIAFGTVLTRKNKTVFSLGITGCGFGALFITILVTHIYFHAISDIVAFSLLLLWIIAALYISKILDSLILSVTAHMGMAISVCCAFTAGFAEGMLILPVIYQIASTAVIILGNIFCCKKTYRFGLLLSMGLSVYSSIVMVNTLHYDLGGLSVGSIILLFAIQTLGISFLSYLLSVSTTKYYDSKETVTDTNIPIAIHIVNKILWIIGISFCVHDVVFLIMARALDMATHSVPFAILCIFPILHLAVTLFMSEKLNFNEKLANISIWINSLFITVLLLIQAETRTIISGVTCIFAFAAVLILIIKYTKNKKLNYLVTLLLGTDILYMTFRGYGLLIDSRLTFLSFIHIAVICSLLFFHWFNQDEETQQEHRLFLKTAEYIWLNIGIISVMCQVHLDSVFSFSLALIILSAINIIAFICKYGGTERNCLNILIKVNSVIIIYTGLTQILQPIEITSDSRVFPFILRILLILSWIGLFYFIAIECLKSKRTVLHLFAGITFALFIDAVCLGLSDFIAIAKIYTDLLSVRPFFLVLTCTLFVILKLTKNDKLSICTLSTLGLDAFLMIVSGYEDLAGESLGALCFVYTLYACAMLYLLWRLQSEEVKQKNILMFKTIGYYWLMGSFASLIFVSDAPKKLTLIFIVFTAINILSLVLKYSGKEKNYLLTNIKIVSVFTLYLSFIEMSTSIPITTENIVLKYILRVGLMLLCAAIYIILAAEWIKSSSVFKQILAGLTFTVFVTAFCNGFTSLLDIAYVFSMICMTTALLCVVLGFIIQAKGLRLYGLTVIIVCVLKLVTIDISSANSTARVVALIAGGIICFAISGLYNRFEQKFIAKKSVSAETSDNNAEI